MGQNETEELQWSSKYLLSVERKRALLCSGGKLGLKRGGGGIPCGGAVECGEDREGPAYPVGKGGVHSDTTSWALEPSWKWMSSPSAWLALLKEPVCICLDKRLLGLQTELQEQSQSGGRDAAAYLWAIFYFLVNRTKPPILQVEKSSHPVL